MLSVLRVDHPLWRLLRPLYLRGQNPYPPVVALAAYFDGSKNREHGIIAVAGYLGIVEMWDGRFTPTWRKVIDSAPHPITEFKASDCRNGFGEFGEPWTKEERNDLTRDFVDVIISPAHQPLGLGAAVQMDYADFETEELREQIEDFAFFWCFSAVARDAIRLSDGILGNDRLHCIFDNDPRTKGRARQAFEGTLDIAAPTFLSRIREPAFEDSEELPPLQAADLLAHETYKELSNRRQVPPRTPSIALSRLVNAAYHYGYWVPLSQAIGVVEQMRRGQTPPTVAAPRLYDSSAHEKICRSADG